MSRGARIVALLAILGMGSVSLCTTAILAWSCCSTDCEGCPVSLYKDSGADLSKKVVSPRIAVSGFAVALSLSVRDFALPVVGIVEVPRSGFLRPMRN
jgi:hypothetical protein